MATRLTFLCAGATAMSRIGGFAHPAEPLDAGGIRQAALLRLSVKRWDHVASSPARAATDTAAVIGLAAAPSDALADMAFGDWSGRSFAQVEASAPDALAAWFADPTSATPGGESMAEVHMRVGAWVDATIGRGATLAIAHATVVRVALAHALALPVEATLQIDVAPLAMLDLSYNGRWRLQELRRP